MEWEDAVEEAKRELHIEGYVDKREWEKVLDLAKEIYWSGEEFNELKEITVKSAEGKCELCGDKYGLTAHHIFYDRSELTICLCHECHQLVHQLQEQWGFVMQLTLKYWNNFLKLGEELPNLFKICLECRKEIINDIENRKKYKKIKVVLEKETEKAILVSLKNTDRQIWIPKSILRRQVWKKVWINFIESKEGEIEVPVWFAEMKLL